jgi:hypothetical protein
MQHFSHHWHGRRNTARRLPKKTPATMPASEITFEKYLAFFEENAALPDKIGRSGVCISEQSGLLLSIQFGYTLSWPTVFQVPVHIDSHSSRLRHPACFAGERCAVVFGLDALIT